VSQLPDHPESEILSPAQRRRGLLFLWLTCAAVGVVMALQMGLNANYVREELHLAAHQQGILEAVRESCGFWALGGLALLAGLAEPIVAMVMLLLLSVGLGGYWHVDSLPGVIGASLVWSFGLHVWMPLPHSMTLRLAEKGSEGRRLGQVRAAGAAGFAGGLIIALGLILLHDRGVRIGLSLRQLYLVAAGAGVVAASLCLGIPRKMGTPGPRLVLRWRYRLFYLLNFLEGWRKQIFVAFAGYLLVDRYGAQLWEILLLTLAVQAISYFASPWVGRLIDRVGERPVLIGYFATLVIFFLGYAWIDSREVLFAIFIADNAMFVMTMALTTYAGRISPPSEYTAMLGMGVAMNHVAATTMPLVGGFLWLWLGYQWTFYAGAAAAVISIPVAMRISPRPKARPETA
jgi:hypothetical protein